MKKVRVTNGVYWVEIPEADLYILCGCPADSVKHLMKTGHIVEREKNGALAQTGPNAILLSDTTMQHGSFSNLAEFPVLQMLYLQGMIIPNHPNNTGRKPMLIGLEDQVRSQSSYIYRGTYGLASLEEIRETGVPEGLARDMLRIKRWFAFDNIRRTEDLLDLRVVDAPAVELRSRAFVRRRGFNRYEFIHGGESVTVDLNLEEGDEYPPTYELARRAVRREQFSVIHTGEGDGWDVTRPCMGSMVCFQGRIYLVDAGPGIQHSLAALGISGNEVAGIFHSHGHDDHFAGLTSLARADRRVPYYAVPPVRASVVKKYAALTGRTEETFNRYFETRDLVLDEWNRVDDGFDVMPVFSAHPVETTIFFFRARGGTDFETYAHLADISSFDVLRKMVTDDQKKNGISSRFFESSTKKMLQRVDVKKIDVGGGLIHGKAEDFAGDPSGKILLSHTSAPLTEAQKKIGRAAVFGEEDVLVETRGDFLRQEAQRLLRSFFPEAADADIRKLAVSPLAAYTPGSIIQAPDTPITDVLLLASGIVERRESNDSPRAMLSAGAMIGELEALHQESAWGTCRAVSHVTALRIPRGMYMEFLTRQGLLRGLMETRANRQFLQSTWLFGEIASFTLQNRIAGIMERRTVKEDTVFRPDGREEVILLADGLVTVFLGMRSIENITPGDFFGEESVLRGTRDLPAGWLERFSRHGSSKNAARVTGASGATLFEARALLDSTVYAIPGKALEDIPIVQWKLMETYERRLKNFRAEVRFEWNDAYGVGIPDLDGQHRELFEMIDGISGIAEGRRSDGMEGLLDRFLVAARAHLQYEETLLSRQPGANFEAVVNGNGEFLRKLEGVKKYLEKAPADALQTTIEFLKDWVLDHSLLENLRFKSTMRL
ncbi:MAG TPA: hemerythrin domain-containing protein [Spirochaetia bacterium]|nr:hemerythrin domain-containing protein [Spirochaetia bacterium]